MQNVGFAYSLIPFVKSGGDKEWISGILTRHICPFNSHPYLTGAIIGSVTRLEAEAVTSPDRYPDAVRRKEALMAPYAAVGDPFFWGGLKPFSAVLGVLLALEGLIVAPLLFFLLYNSVHIWIRVNGFIEGYRDGNGAIGFLGKLGLPHKTRVLKWGTTVLLAILSVIFLDSSFSSAEIPWGFALGGTCAVVLLCSWLVSKGVSSLAMLYGAALVFVVVA